jgi:single-strand DNA-binding protein
MATLNNCQFIGRLGKDPEYKAFGESGCANFTIAVGEKYKGKDGTMQERTEWVSCVAWGKLGEIANKFLGKGKEVFVEGRMATRKWQGKDGNDRYTTEIVVENLQMLGPKGGEQPQNRGEFEQTANDDLPF